MDCDGYPRIPMPLMCTAFVPGQIDAAVAGISDPNSRAIATAEALYFRGQATLAAKTRAPILTPPIPHCAIPHALSADTPVCRSTVSPTPAGALLASSIRRPTRNRPPSTPRISCSPRPRASCCTCLPRICRRVLSTCGASTEGLRLFASYVMAHALYLRGEYGRSLGMAENA